MIVAVVGLGSVGLVTLKNMLDAGFEVVGFEKANNGELERPSFSVVSSLTSLPLFPQSAVSGSGTTIQMSPVP